ncbi:hypothetical protein DFH06DRAFT_1346824 [Mycena polygramma]|nr:hypothetical protein DFH06DRAFT_1346824 [Mycena polygramma]
MLVVRSDSPAASTSFASLVFPTTDPPQSPTSPKTDVAKSVIEWLFVVIAIILILCLFLRKLFGVRTSPRVTDSVYQRGSISFAPSGLGDPAYICSYIAYPGIPPVELPYPPIVHPRTPRPLVRLTRGLDIGEDGRRANSDMELVLGDKDLPAYDGLDRPPRYAPAAPGETSAAIALPERGAAATEVPDVQLI